MKDVDDYIQQGIHGAKETNPDERRRYLTSLRERVVIALKQMQLLEAGIYPEVEEAMKNNKEAHLYLNGNLDYEFISKYKKIASKYGIEFTIVTNKEYDSELGLVLAYNHAIDKENIYVEKKRPSFQLEQQKKKGFFAKLFGR